jgi:predicted outer membrane lipoprotein
MIADRAQLVACAFGFLTEPLLEHADFVQQNRASFTVVGSIVLSA